MAEPVRWRARSVRSWWVDHQVVAVGEVGDRLVDDRHVAEAGGLDLLAQHRGAHGRGAHAGVAGEDDRADRAGAAPAPVPSRTPEIEEFLPLCASMLEVAAGQVTVVVAAVDLEQEGGDRERDSRPTKTTDRVTPMKLLGGRGGPDRDDRAGRGRRPQARAEGHVGGDTGRTAEDDGDDQLGLHQHVGEVDLVDAADELDEDRARRRGLGDPLAEQREGQQQAEAGAGVGLEQEQDRLALLDGLGWCRAGSGCPG